MNRISGFVSELKSVWIFSFFLYFLELKYSVQLNAVQLFDWSVVRNNCFLNFMRAPILKMVVFEEKKEKSVPSLLLKLINVRTLEDILCSIYLTVH